MFKYLSIIVVLIFQSSLAFADFSPDGKQITFNIKVNGSSQIFIANSDGKQSKQISQENGEYFNPTWSPLGEMIAFTKSEGGNSYIGVMDINGSNERMITTGHLVENPSWSNDGKRILFYKFDDKDNGGLYIIDITGFNETLIKSN
jgi:TolB protein